MHTGFWWENQKERTTRKPGYRWEDSIKMDCREIGWGSMDWIHLADDAIMCFCEHSNESSGSIKYWEILDSLSDCYLLKDLALWS
jgi:hypothetical protein